MNEYEKQAADFLAETNTTFKAEYKRTGLYFPKDKDPRDIYEITLTRGTRSWSFEFGQSIADSGFYVQIGRSKYPLERKYLDKTSYRSDLDKIHYPKPPTAYDVLACLTKYDVGTFENFCSEFGYDEDSRTAEKIYKAVYEEWLNVQKMWSDTEIEKLQEIQ